MYGIRQTFKQVQRKPKRISIRMPIWKQPRSVGVATSKLSLYDSELEITYKDGYGKRIYPNTYLINWSEAKQYPSK